MKIGIIGTGYIGLNTALFFARKGVKVIGVDIDKKKIKALCKNVLPIKELYLWLTFDVTPLLKDYMKFTTNFDTILKDKEIEAIFIAVPTEKDGEPYFKALTSVIDKIKNSPNKDKLVIIESTLMPGVSDKYVKPYIKNFVIAPRRDWLGFEEAGRTLQNLPRIVGGSNEKTTKKALEILSIVCNKLHPCRYDEAELVKALENSMRHVGSVYAQELAWAYPHLDTRKILKLAATKWNVPLYYPNILGTSGYCIPISSKYVVDASKDKKDFLSIASNTISTDNWTSIEIANTIKKTNVKSIAIVGIAYLGNIKVHILSGATRLLSHFKKMNEYSLSKDKIKVKVHDPLYTTKELKKITGCKTFKFPDDLDKFEVVILTAGHDYYGQCDKKKLIEKTRKCKYVLDNTGIWEDIKFKCPYVLPGRAKWLEKIKIFN